VADLIVSSLRGALHGSVPVPADKSIAHRGLILAAIASGESRLHLGHLGDDNRATLDALRALGVSIDERDGEVSIRGAGLGGLRAPDGPIDCGNSGTTMRLLAGLLSAQRFATELIGDASLSQRPMHRVARPLRLRGARIEGRVDPDRVGELTAPLQVGPLPEPHCLSGQSYEMPIASAQVKSAILLAGLYADGPTYVREPTISRDHTERMMSTLGVPLSRAGGMIALEPASWSGELPGFELEPAGDSSAAAFILAAALTLDDSRVTMRRVCTNPTRSGMMELARDMGATVETQPLGDTMGESVAELTAVASALSGATLAGERLTRAIDEVPAACVLMASAEGESHVHDATELRVKESDRLAAMVRVLRAFGVAAEERADGLDIEGHPAPLSAAEVHSGGDHRIAMAATVLALRAKGESRIRDAACITTSFPRFVGTLRALGAEIRVES